MNVQLSLDETYADVAPVRTDPSGMFHFPTIHVMLFQSLLLLLLLLLADDDDDDGDDADANDEDNINGNM